MGGDLPMAGVTFRADLAEKLVEGSQPGTFAGNALSSVVCMTNIDIITDKNDELINRAAQLGKHVKNRLQEGSGDCRIIGDARGRGLMIGVEFVKNKGTREPLGSDAMNKIITGLLNRGLIMVPCGRYNNVLRFMPSLTITREYLEKTTDIFLGLIKDIEPGII